MFITIQAVLAQGLIQAISAFSAAATRQVITSQAAIPVVICAMFLATAQVTTVHLHALNLQAAATTTAAAIAALTVPVPVKAVMQALENSNPISLKSIQAL